MIVLVNLLDFYQRCIIASIDRRPSMHKRKAPWVLRSAPPTRERAGTADPLGGRRRVESAMKKNKESARICMQVLLKHIRSCMQRYETRMDTC